MSLTKKLHSYCLSLIILITFVSLSGREIQAQNIKITDLQLSKRVVKLTGKKKKEFPLTQRGFLWQKDDAETKSWRPQGVTGLTVGGQEFILVSWYGRPKMNLIGTKVKKSHYKNRGARISIVNLTQLEKNPSAKNYRNVLLVDKNNKTYYDMHAGGIVALNGMLHVADSRGKHRVIRVFDLNKIQKPAKPIFKYTRVLIEEYNYKAPIKPSYISYDRDRKQILMGTFAEKPSGSRPNLMAWFTPPANASEAATFNNNLSKITVYRLPNKYKKIQGMVASKHNGKQVLWLSTSFGRFNRSNFYKMYIDINSNTPKSPTVMATMSSSGRKYPPGLEDAYLAPNNQLWLLTEFAFGLGTYRAAKIKGDGRLLVNKTRRAVFAISKSAIIPK